MGSPAGRRLRVYLCGFVQALVSTIFELFCGIWPSEDFEANFESFPAISLNLIGVTAFVAAWRNLIAN